MRDSTAVLLPLIVKCPREIRSLFQVAQPKSIGIISGDQIGVAEVDETDLDFSMVPSKKFRSILDSRPLPQQDPSLLYVKTQSTLALLDMKSQTVTHRYTDFSKSIEVGYDLSKVIDHNKGDVLSLFHWFPKSRRVMQPNMLFAVDNLIEERRVKQLEIESPFDPFPVHFTPSFTFFRPNYDVPWKALDNDLNEIGHPLVDILNKNDSVFSPSHEDFFISEKFKHALCISYNQIMKKDMLFLLTWHGDPTVTPIPVDSALTSGGRRLIGSSSKNTMSPSGKWVYFAIEGTNVLEDTHFLVYLDPALPTGILPPIQLPIEGSVDASGWMTTPEGLVLYKDEHLLYWDLSQIDPVKLLKE